MRSSHSVIILVTVCGLFFFSMLPRSISCNANKDSQTEVAESSKSDIGLRAAQRAVDQIAKEFEISDAIESRLVFVEVLFSKEDLDASLISIILFRNDRTGGRSKTYENRSAENMVIRMTRVVTSTVSQPFAVITTTKVKKGIPVTRERILQYNDTKGWQDWKHNIASQSGQ